jgi:Cof subfamily protein (haloacid dehalogenase superfamily)
MPPTVLPMTDIRMLLADVDGTLVSSEKVLTDAAVAAVRDLRTAGILFAVTSGRPPRGMEMLIGPLQIDEPLAAFNGGLIVEPDMTVAEARTIPDGLVEPIAGLMGDFRLDVWVYSGADWFVPDRNGPHVDREAWTVKFEPKIMRTVADVARDVSKLVGVSDDHDAVARAADAAHDRFGKHVTAAPSQPYYLDVTHPDANKGAVVAYLADRHGLKEEQIATIGDMPNDILMFDPSGLAIAMGNAEPAVKEAADHVTDSNDEDGFAKAVRRFILAAAP